METFFEVVRPYILDDQGPRGRSPGGRPAGKELLTRPGGWISGSRCRRGGLDPRSPQDEELASEGILFILRIHSHAKTTLPPDHGTTWVVYGVYRRHLADQVAVVLTPQPTGITGAETLGELGSRVPGDIAFFLPW